jgi:hypothetical protein
LNFTLVEGAGPRARSFVTVPAHPDVENDATAPTQS